jgi:trans-aconitate methyltransferase
MSDRPSAFHRVAASYDARSVAQRAAADRLLSLLELEGGEDVLDVGCGTGYLLERLRERTSGRLVGVDPSPEMIERARARGLEGVELRVGAAEGLDERAAFDAVVSNSAFHWFRDPPAAFARMRAALRPGGRLAVQAPATSDYCPAFVGAMAEVARHPDTSDGFARWRAPWWWLETAEAYAALVAGAGFRVEEARIEPHLLTGDAGLAMTVYDSAAAAGYLDPAHRGLAEDDGYAPRARALVRAHLERLAGPDGRLELLIRRAWIRARAV